MHSLEDAEQFRLEVLTMRAEMMIEEGTALVFRTDIEAADAVSLHCFFILSTAQI